mgnify:CR=1 FL=1
MKLTLVTPPAHEPVSLAEAKLHLRIADDATDEDALIASLIVAARQHLDGYSGILGRCLIDQTWALELDGFRDVIGLPLPPLRSVASVEYYDRDGVLQTVSPDVYDVVAGGTSGGYIQRRPGQSWPATGGRSLPVKVTFVAGYGPDWNAVPQPIRHAMLLLVGHWYANREAVGAGAPLPFAVDALLTPYRMVTLP